VYEAASASASAKGVGGGGGGGGDGRWRGHRVWLVDGSGVSMPDAPALQKAFGQSGQQ
jgi:hypothetical protein